RRRGAAAPGAAAVGARPGDDLPEVSGEGAGAALRQRGSPGRRPGPLPGRRGNPGPAALDLAAGCPLGTAPPGGGRRRRDRRPPPGDLRRRLAVGTALARPRTRDAGEPPGVAPPNPATNRSEGAPRQGGRRGPRPPP